MGRRTATEPVGTANIPYDEFGLFAQNAAEVGLEFRPPVVRREAVEVSPGRYISSLRWGTGTPQYVLLHGGAQNAHTWDTVALALDAPLLAIDLPGHGHSDAGSTQNGDAAAAAQDVATVVRTLAPEARVIVGMSFGGMTTLSLIAAAPELVPSAVLVDITPGVDGPKSRAIVDFINGPRSFANFDEILARTVEHNPTRTRSSLRRGILHNAEQQGDGSWVWRYRRFDEPGTARYRAGPRNLSALWSVLDGATMPILLVRGMRPQSVVDDADEAEFLRRTSRGTVVRIADAGHSVQGDTPLELAGILAEFRTLTTGQAAKR